MITNNFIFDKLLRLPLKLISIYIILTFIGILILYSAAGGHIHPWAYKQILRFILMLPLCIFIIFIDLRYIYNHSYHIYAVTLILLVLTELIGRKVMGATRWIDLGFIRLQPSEIFKISLVLSLAKFFHNCDENQVNDFSKLLSSALLAIFPALLIIKQPDLGTGIIAISIYIIILFAAGLKIKYFINSGIVGIILLPIFWQMLHDYQKKRLLIFLNPESDPLGSGYNIIQSQIAIGSGGFFGKGLLSSTQTKLSFLPEYQTDFIFSFLTEELGFMGGMMVIFLFSLLLGLCSICVANARAKYTKFLIIGLSSIIFLHVFINIAMVMGLLPVVGVPLPLISYGGTIQITIMITMSLIINAIINQNTSL